MNIRNQISVWAATLLALFSGTLVVGAGSPNTPPTISVIRDQTIERNGVLATSFTINDAETQGDELSVSVTSSNMELIPEMSIVLSGSGLTRNLAVIPMSDQTGQTIITITVTDEQGLAARATFTLRVGSDTPPLEGNTPPSIAPLGDLSVDDVFPAPFVLRVSDAETPSYELIVTGSSSNQEVVPDENILIGRIDGDGNVRGSIIPSDSGTRGSTRITIVVADPQGLSASATFTFDFAVTVVEVRPMAGDFNRDGNADILFQDADGNLAVWLMNGFSLLGAQFLTPNNVSDPAYRVAGLGRFGSDDRDSILFQHENGTLAVWRMNGPSLLAAELLNPSRPSDRNWSVVGVADIDLDGGSDLLFQHTDGTLAAWLMDGVRLSSASLISPANPGDPHWRVAGAADFNGDNRPDLLFQHQDGTLAVWRMNGLSLASATLLDPPNPGDSAWRVAGVIDLNRDGKTDLLFQNSRDNSLAGWLMDGTRMTAARLLDPINPGGTWRAIPR